MSAPATKTNVSSFRTTYARDKKTGSTRALADYLELFPEDEKAVAEEYLAFEDDWSDSEDHRGDRSTLPGHSPETPAKTEVGPYRLIREIGRGGQGRVYLAEDRRLKRQVALKTVEVDPDSAQEVLLRFRREAEVLSRLHHDGICPVFDAGCEDGTAFIVMRHIEGESLAHRLRETRDFDESGYVSFEETGAGGGDEARPARSTRPKTPPQGRTEIMSRLLLLEQAARALHAAHEAGVVHRDVKPSNIMVTDAGRPVICDFGLARRTEDGPHQLTRSGELYGTPSYMAPEQIMGAARPDDRRADVYSLGVTLYECLTLHRPYEAANRQALYHAITTGEPTDPRRHNPAITGELAVVIATAIERDPEHRYKTSLELAEDLRRIREYEPILARPAGRMLRLRRWSQRNPLLAASLASVFLLLVIGLGLTTQYLRQEARQRTTLAAALEVVRQERDAKEAALADARREREAKEAFFDLAVELLSRTIDKEEPRVRVDSPAWLDAARAFTPDTSQSIDYPALRKLTRLPETTRIRPALVAPRGAIDNAFPIFEIEAPLGTQAFANGTLALRCDDGRVQKLEVRDEAADECKILYRLPEDAKLESGHRYRWTVSFADAAKPSEAPKTPLPVASFRLVAPEKRDRLLADVPQTGDPLRDGLARARRLLRHAFASDAIREIEKLPAPISERDESFRIFLLGRAYALLGRPGKVVELRKRVASR